MTAAAQVVTLINELDQIDTILAVLAGTAVSATITVTSSVGQAPGYTYSPPAATISGWQSALATQKANLQSQLSALGIVLT